MAELPKRATIRWTGYDYANVGAYYLTIVTDDRRSLFGRITDGVMHPSPIGMLVQRCWDAIPEHMPHVDIGEFVVMPNHVHGIIVITDVAGGSLAGDGTVGAANSRPLRIPATNDPVDPPPPDGTDIRRRPPIAIMVPNSLGHIMQTFKAVVSRQAVKDGLLPTAHLHPMDTNGRRWTSIRVHCCPYTPSGSEPGV